MDIEAPQINCVEDRQVETDKGNSTATVFWQTPVATDIPERLQQFHVSPNQEASLLLETRLFGVKRLMVVVIEKNAILTFM